MKKLFTALAAATALTAATALPASATVLADGDMLPTVNNINWGAFLRGDDGFSIEDAKAGDGTVATDAFDGFGRFQWYDVATTNWTDWVFCDDAVITAATDVNTDYVFTCDPELDVFDGIDTDIAGRLYGEGDMVRLEYTITNNSGADFEFSWYSENNYGEGIEDDNETVDLARGFDIQTYDGAYNNYPSGIAFGKQGSASYPDSEGAIDIADDYADINGPANDNVVLAAGSSATIVIFYFHAMDGSTNGYPSDDYDFITLWAEDAFASWSADPRISRGIADDVFVANWMDEAPAAAASELASTGTDATGTLALGAAALVAGAVAMIVRRRRTV